ncbi:very short patch repair endonuclease [Billgrantia gudaonensis]|uniref:Very short patch repair endonuclease n=1 Tax=Billgrantia gudaonensis TaxID=376427 RepID=A0A1G8YLL7_9GAMM|nr:very short patch repair endonuclease [Halomonas gudaonensis]SDK03688.1 T/G mismatch-specific endonuclease [Halomonas gudaonensis]
MVDSVDRETRSRIMGRVRNKDTRPEMTVRRLVHGAGYRYRLHGKKLPGKPDLVFKSRRKVIFVHGCFWHRHEGCTLARLPKSRLDFWLPKLEANRERDKRNEEHLREMGWDVLIIWECELKDQEALLSRVSAFLDQSRQS